MTQTISKTFNGDGNDVKRVDTDVWFHTSPDTDSGTIVKTEYYVRSTVLGGQKLTELDENGNKKLTNVYTGSGVLAEQRVSASTPFVYWRHEDLVTGSYTKTAVGGQVGQMVDNSPATVEYDPMGGAIQTTAPANDLVLTSLLTFKYYGDTSRPEQGCMIAFMPAFCNTTSKTVSLELKPHWINLG